MTNSKTTKKALTASVVSLVLCFLMLLGATFAWFTDTATTTVNKIQAGTLDVDIEQNTTDGWQSVDGKELGFVNETGEAMMNIHWEPGATYNLPTLRVVNDGSLALKYKATFSAVSGDTKLAEVIDVLLDGRKVGTLSDLLNSTDADGFAHGNLLAGADSGELKVSLQMQESAGNDYQGLSIEGVVVTVYATQDTVESDSISNQYDAAASFQVWDGFSREANWNEYELKNATAENPVNIDINTAAEFAQFVYLSNNVTSFKNVTVNLKTDLDLNEKFIDQIGKNSKIGFFQGTFDGNNHAIYGFKVDYKNVYGDRGLFSVLNGATVKNLTIDGADLTNSNVGGIGIIAGCTTSEKTAANVPVIVDNVTVKNSIVRRTGDDSGRYQKTKVAIFFGNVNGKDDVIIRNCKIENSAVVASEDGIPISAWYGRNEGPADWQPTIENSDLSNVFVGTTYNTDLNPATVSLDDILNGEVVLTTEIN